MAVHAEQQVYSGHVAAESSPVLRALLSMTLVLTAALAFAIALAAGLIVGYGLYYQDQVYPGVQAVGVDIGGTSATAAEATLDERTNAYLSNQITFEHNGNVYTADASELGIEFDNARTVQNAYEFGRSGTWWSDSWDWLDSLLFGHDVGVHVTVDQGALEAYLRSISNEVATSPREPAFQLSDSGEIQITEPANGVGIDVGQTMQGLSSELSRLGDEPIAIATTEVEPRYERSALEPVQGQMNAILAEPLILERGGYQWELTTRHLEALLDVNVDAEAGESTLSVDRDRLERHVSSIAGTAEGVGSNASVRWTGDSYEVVPATAGWIIDVEGSVERIAEGIQDGDDRVELATESQQAAITTEAAEEAATFGNELADSRFGLTWDGGETDIGGSVIAAAMSFEADSDSGTLTPDVDAEELRQYLTSVSGDIEVEPVDADLRYYGGEVVVESEERMGQEMDLQASAESIAEAVENGETSAQIVVEPTEPEVTAAMADDIEIREVLASGETYYHGSSANRAHNVELATERANGTLVPPGGTYSFVESIGGEINLDVGYRQGFGIVGATDGGVSTVPSVGGGVCQVSTTLFHAAFWAGLEIGERNWHLYWIPTYGQDPSGMTGLDATVDTDAGLDFTFKNTTNDWIAVVSSANNGTVRFEIQGTDPGWNVETSGPHISNRVSASSETVYEETDQLPAGTQSRVESAHDGFDVLIERQVYNSDGELIDDLDLNSRYRPASNRVLVGTGD